MIYYKNKINGKVVRYKTLNDIIKSGSDTLILGVKERGKNLLKAEYKIRDIPFNDDFEIYPTPVFKEQEILNLMSLISNCGRYDMCDIYNKLEDQLKSMHDLNNIIR